VDVADFDFTLPSDLIAQRPPVERGTSRMLVLDRGTGGVTHSTIGELGRWLQRGDLLVLNDTRVFPARLIGRREASGRSGGGRVEWLLLQRLDQERWEALVHPGQKLKPGARVVFDASPLPPGRLHGEVLERKFYGRRVVRLWTEDGSDVLEVVEQIGHVPLPPYIRRPDEPADRERYQTVYARAVGSVAAPTAGLHLTSGLLESLRHAGVEIAELTLHVGYGTFKPVRSANVEDHVVDPERYAISSEAAAALNRALDERRRVVAVGSTTTRALESAAARAGGHVEAGAGTADAFIYPGFHFQVIKALLTNFHLPRSSLLMMVCAFGGRERLLAAYREAVAERYRFYSYGDAMLIV
jgi:S-adenosylmethionine:tRNA ribosyltransferase-isomerase